VQEREEQYRYYKHNYEALLLKLNKEQEGLNEEKEQLTLENQLLKKENEDLKGVMKKESETFLKKYHEMQE